MNAEQLLKSISELLKKNEDFLNQNPELFHVIEDRLFKAIDYEDYQPEDYDDPEDYYNDAYDNSELSDLFDDIPEDDIDEDMDGEIDDDEAAKWLKENDDAIQNGEDVDGDGDLDINFDHRNDEYSADDEGDGGLGFGPDESEQPKEKAKVSRSGYREWAPKDKYEDAHQAAIDKLMGEGWSHREAERMAGAHDQVNSFEDALRSKVKPTQPSDKMLSTMKGLAGNWLREAERKMSASADARKNPVKAASAKTLTAHDDAHGEFKNAYDQFLQSDDLKGLKGRERHKAIRAFKEKWNAENPEHRENAIAAADSGKAYTEADQARAERLLEGHQALQDVGKVGGEASSAGEFSTAASGGLEGMTNQGAAQMAGGTQDEGGYTTGTVKDPAAVFNEQHKDYLNSQARQKSIDRLKSKLSPEQAERFSTLSGIKGNK